MTKKSTRYSSRVSDFLFVLVCLAAATLGFLNFWNHLNQSLTKSGTQQIATITFKYHTAQRRFLDRVLWDRLRQNSPLYNGDTVRVAEKSEATVHFTDGSAVDLSENTLAQFTVREETGLVAKVDGGGLRVQASDKGMSVSSGGQSITVRGSSLVDIVSGKKIKISVEKGSASLETESGTENIDEGTVVAVSSEGQIEKPAFSVISPAASTRILDFGAEPVPVQFKCSYTGKDAVVGLLEISDTKDFLKPEHYEFPNLDSIKAGIKPGVWYWRVSVIPAKGGDKNAETLSAAGRVSVLYAPKPELIAPISGYSTRYRKRQPALRFIWTENDYASSYQLEIADNREMKTPAILQRTQSASSIVSELGEGTWYWRVTPFYAINDVGLAEPTEISSFRIIKSGELIRPELMMPLPETVANTAKKSADGAQGVALSWRNDPEALSYTLKVAKDGNMAAPVITLKTSSNYYFIDNSRNQLEKNCWYQWQVSVTDFEGNTAESETRRFYSTDSELVQRTVFPPEGYRISQTFTPDIKYVWKTNVPVKTHFEISAQKDFSSDAIADDVTTGSFSGRSLEPGTYYWRISAKVGALDMQTEPKLFIVEPPIASPTVISPSDGGRAVVEHKDKYHFAWNQVPGADYYSFRLYSEGTGGHVIYERDYLTDTGLDINLQDYEEKNYHWTLQAFRDENMAASRSTGYIGSYIFTLRQLLPMTLLWPENKAEIDGVTAFKTPETVKWSSVDTPASSRFVLYRGSVNDDNIVTAVNNPQNSIKLPRLSEGTYFWTVSGTTSDDLDISALETRSFSVGKIPDLPLPGNPQPINALVINKDYLIKSRKIVFSWEEVRDATRYVFRLTSGGKVIIEKNLGPGECSVTLSDLTALGQGDFVWTVEAQSYYEGRLFQKSPVLLRKFSVILPKLQQPESDDPGEKSAAP